MNKERWKTVNEIFHAALDLPASQRPAFVSAAASDDAELRSEVERMLAADASADGYLETPPHFDLALPNEFSIQPGDLLKDRFNVQRLIGEGGMGRVFEAWDTELKVKVALKAIRPEIARDPAIRASFRREVRIARTITHPNVCRIYELDRAMLPRDGVTQQEQLFLTMEFLEGESLAARLARTGKMDLEQVREFARQIASGLDAAHSAGIVHRDIKPANIMLVAATTASFGGTRVVITDFGLAHAETLQSALMTASISHGSPVGTVAYMAPEQMDHGGAMTPATDVYAFGLVLFEMATGRRAFPSANLLTGIAQRLSAATPSPQAIFPELPDIWETVIQGCLHRDPAQRFQSAGAALEALAGGAATPPKLSSPVGSGPSSKSPVQAKARQRWLIAAAVIFLIAVALLGAWMRLHQQQEPSPVAPGALVYLAPIDNQTDNRKLDDLNAMLKSSLSQSAQITLLDQDRVGDIMQRMTKAPDATIDTATAREIAMRAAAVRVIFVTATGSNGSYQLNVSIENPDNTPTRARERHTQSFPWQTSGSTTSQATIPAQLLTAVRNSTDWLRREVGESASDLARAGIPPEDATTGNWEALEELGNADRFVSEHEPEKAVLALQSATRLDPKFALAYARLGDQLFALDRSAEGYQAYSRALSSDLIHRLTRKERDFIKGSYAVDTWDFSVAEEAFRDYAAYYENDYEAVFFRAYPLRMLGRSPEAIDVLKRALELAPASYAAHLGLGYNYLLLGDLEAARHSVEELNKLDRPDEASLLNGHVQFLSGNYAASLAEFQKMKSAKTVPHRSLSYQLMARVQAEQGKFAEAAATLDAGLDFDHSRGRKEEEAGKWLDKAYLECRRGSIETCVTSLDNAMEIASRPEMILRGSAILGAAVARAHGPQIAALQAALKRLQQRLGNKDYGPIYELAKFRLNGEMKLAQGSAIAALADFREAEALDFPITEREYLARALIAAAKATHSSSTRRNLFEEARAAYERCVNHPAVIWYYASRYPPGFLADQLEDDLQLAPLLNNSAAPKLHLQLQLAQLRGNHPPTKSIQ